MQSQADFFIQLITIAKHTRTLLDKEWFGSCLFGSLQLQNDLVVVYLGPNNCRKTLSVVTLSSFICKWNWLTWQVNNRLHLIIEGRITRSHIVASGVESARFYGWRSVLSVTLRSLNHSVDSPLSRVRERHRGDVLRRRRPDRRCPHEPV